MACSHCQIAGHNIQTCPSVRRCGHCNGHGHDRRNCPFLAHLLVPPSFSPTTGECCSIQRLLQLCSQDRDFLVHIYWPHREEYFHANIPLLKTHHLWRLVSTPGHGVLKPVRPTINFFLANSVFAQGYPSASCARGFRHGVLFRRAAIERFANTRGYDFAEVRVGHPNGFKERRSAEYWRYDIGKWRLAALHDLRFATVVRLATPEGVAQYVHVPADAVVAWW